MSTSSGASKPSFASSSGFFGWFDRRIAPPLHRFGQLAVVAAIREALPWSFTGLLCGLLFLVWFVPASGANFWERLAGRIAGALLPALAIMASVLLVLLAVKIARRLRFSIGWYVAACVAAFGLSLPQPFDSHVFAYLRTLGESGLFLAIVINLLVAGIFASFQAIGRRRAIVFQEAAPRSALRAALLLRSSPLPPSMAPRFVHSLLGALSLVVALVIFGALFVLHISLANVLFEALWPLAWLGDSYVALIVIVGVETVLWTAGVHGPALLAAIVTPVYLTLQTQNAQAFAQHQVMPHIVTVSLFLFVFPGGAGATLPLAIFLAVSRIPRLRKLGRVTLLPALVNINEPLLFGLPIVFNPFLAVPFIFSPIVLATMTYVAVAMDWVGKPIYYYPSSIPTVISTYLATLDIRAVGLVVVNICVAGIIYFPFVRAYEHHLISKEAV